MNVFFIFIFFSSKSPRPPELQLAKWRLQRTTTENGLITINLLTLVYPLDTPANQPEFEEFFNSGCWSDWNSQLELDQVSHVSEDMEENSERNMEQNMKKQMDKNMEIKRISNKLIRPLSRSRGVKDLSLLKEPFIEDVSEEEATQPEMRLQQMVKELATSINGERIEEEIRALKRKITDKAEALKRNRSFGEDLLRNLDEEEAEIRSNMERQISFVRRRRQNIQNILDSQKKEELLKNILI
ncbi:uncharacterized protein LOC107399035 isoform X1 [Tribolium castaneum]|uniref:uncharacterized protein LOC107399035 isoform X1 n=1 Tax=Tribolium castaneum TaxID=7070 RepID=UPI0030FEC0DE